jgi:hypothetical protein
MSTPFRYIKCNNTEIISKKLLYIFDTFHKISAMENGSCWFSLEEIETYCSELLDFMNVHNLKFKSGLCFVKSNNNNIKPHVDFTPGIRLNFPILNSEHAKTNCFEKVQDELLIKSNTKVLPYYTVNIKNCQLIDYYILDRPLLFDPSYPHNIILLKSKIMRVMITIFLENPPDTL